MSSSRTTCCYLAQERKLAASSLNVAVSGVALPSTSWVLQRPDCDLWRALPRVRKAVRRPQVFSMERSGAALHAWAAPIPSIGRF